MSRLGRVWRTTTVRLTALFILIFVVFSIALLAYMAWQSSLAIQRQQVAAIARETNVLKQIDQQQGVRNLIFAVQRLGARPGPGIYFLGDQLGQMIAGNVSDVPANILQSEGFYTFTYTRQRAFDGTPDDSGKGVALVRTTLLSNGLRLVVGRDIVERRGYSAIILGGFAFAVLGIIAMSVLAGGLTAMRVLRRIDTITATSTKIMSGNLSERVPVTRRDDEFDRLATSLNAMLERIEQLMQGLKEVTDNVAHDLKTPLTRMRNRAEAALRDDTDVEAQKAALETTIAESDQLIRTFNALLMIARAEAGAPSGAFSDLDVSAAVADVAELYGPVAEDAGMTLDMDVAEGVRVKAIRELIGQALVNLVENAIKYAASRADRPGQVTLGVHERDGRVIIEVADNGPGIPEQDRKRVIERFVRLEKSRTEPGSGLGLSLVAAVAHLHGGTFRLEDNAPGVRAIIDLPASGS